MTRQQAIDYLLACKSCAAEHHLHTADEHTEDDAVFVAAMLALGVAQTALPEHPAAIPEAQLGASQKSLAAEPFPF